MTASVNVVNTPIRVTVSASGTAVTVASTGPAAPGGSGTVTGVSATSPIVSDGSSTSPTISHATTLGGNQALSFITAISVNTFGHVTAITGVDASTMRGALGLKNSATLDVGTAAGTVSAGDDSRLSDARTPVAHSADLVTSGTLGVDRIPTITLAKVSDSGTAAAADTGTGSTNVILGNDSRLTDARTPVAHSTDLLTSGTLAVARGGTGSATAPMMGVVTAADASAARSVLGLGTASTSASTAFVASSAVSTYGASLVDDADASAARTTLGLGTAATTDATAYAAAAHDQSAATITSGTLAVARGGTGVTSLPMIGVASAADAAAARTVLGLGTASTVNTGTSAGNLVVLDGSAKLPAVDGSQLTNVAGSGGGSDWHGQDPSDTGVIRLFDDFLGVYPSWAMLGTSGSYWEDGWEFDDAGASASGFMKWRTGASAYARNSISLTQFLNASPADGTEAMWEVRAKAKWNASSTNPYFAVAAFCPKSDLSPTTTEPSGGYGDTVKFFVTAQKGSTYVHTGGRDVEGSNGNPTTTDTDVGVADDTWFRLGIHIKYVAASSAWRCQAYVNGVAKNSTFDLTAGTQAPTFGFWSYNAGNGHVNEGLVDWMSLQYTRPRTISYVDIDDI